MSPRPPPPSAFRPLWPVAAVAMVLGLGAGIALFVVSGAPCWITLGAVTSAILGAFLADGPGELGRVTTG